MREFGNANMQLFNLYIWKILYFNILSRNIMNEYDSNVKIKPRLGGGSRMLGHMTGKQTYRAQWDTYVCLNLYTRNN